MLHYCNWRPALLNPCTSESALCQCTCRTVARLHYCPIELTPLHHCTTASHLRLLDNASATLLYYCINGPTLLHCCITGPILLCNRSTALVSCIATTCDCVGVLLWLSCVHDTHASAHCMKVQPSDPPHRWPML